MPLPMLFLDVVYAVFGAGVVLVRFPFDCAESEKNFFFNITRRLVASISHSLCLVWQRLGLAFSTAILLAFWRLRLFILSCRLAASQSRCMLTAEFVGKKIKKAPFLTRVEFLLCIFLRLVFLSFILFFICFIIIA